MTWFCCTCGKLNAGDGADPNDVTVSTMMPCGDCKHKCCWQCGPRPAVNTSSLVKSATWSVTWLRAHRRRKYEKALRGGRGIAVRHLLTNSSSECNQIYLSKSQLTFKSHHDVKQKVKKKKKIIVPRRAPPKLSGSSDSEKMEKITTSSRVGQGTRNLPRKTQLC